MSTTIANLKLGDSTLAALDARTLKERWYMTVADRLLYPAVAPSGLALWADGSRIAVAHYRERGPDVADYW